MSDEGGDSGGTRTATAVPTTQHRRPAQAEPEALQIVSIGTEADEYAFTYHEDALRAVVSKIPPERKVAVVSVVGAFRTGKSFLLSWFLRYLDYHHGEGAKARVAAAATPVAKKVTGAAAGGEDDDPALVSDSENENGDDDGDDDGEGKPATATAEKDDDGADGKPWYETFDSVGRHSGFDWRGGAERNTSGIWIWSEPFAVPVRGGETVAVLVVDTQGMFDHETTMSLTAAIFGLSTLLSSYQIYNVDKRIQEDNLQQLALFSEYGRIALEHDKEVIEDDSDGDEKGEVRKGKPQDKGEGDAASTKDDEDGGENEKTSSQSSGEAPTETKAEPAAADAAVQTKPFQKIEFLVRDWQNFDADADDDGGIDAMIAEMAPYLDSVLEERSAADLRETREQIDACFERVSCFLFSHPGFAVTKKKYAGEVGAVDPTFLRLLDAYCRRVFGAENLEPKVIHGRQLTASELEAYIRAYANMFESGAHFPEATTMLEATASANNSNATNLAISKYRAEMDRIAGPVCTNYVRPAEFQQLSQRFLMSSLEMFDDMADFGSKRSIRAARDAVLREIGGSRELYAKLNDSRNPLMGFETFFVPMAIAILSFLLRWIADTTCSSWSQTCRASSDILSQVYAVVFIFLLIVASTKAKQISERLHKLKAALL